MYRLGRLVFGRSSPGAIVGMALPLSVSLYGHLSHDNFLSFLFFVKFPHLRQCQ